LVVWRRGKKITLNVAVGELKEEQVSFNKPIDKKSNEPAEESEIPSLGLKLAGLNATNREKFKIKKSSKGVVITFVDPNGTAAEQGLKKGDLIVEVAQTQINNPKDVNKKVEEARSTGRKSILLLMERSNGIGFVAIRIGKN